MLIDQKVSWIWILFAVLIISFKHICHSFDIAIVNFKPSNMVLFASIAFGLNPNLGGGNFIPPVGFPLITQKQ